MKITYSLIITVFLASIYMLPSYESRLTEQEREDWRNGIERLTIDGHLFVRPTRNSHSRTLTHHPDCPKCKK